jgi:hypothetical protein
MFNWFKRSSKSAPTTRAGPVVAAPVGTAGRRPSVRRSATADQRPDDSASKPDPTLSRLAPCATQFGPHTQRILAHLPPGVRLDRTCAQFPHVVDALLRHWSNPAAFRIALDGLMIDSRGGRQGFPFDVMMEFSALRDYYDESVDPLRKAGWDRADVR